MNRIISLALLFLVAVHANHDHGLGGGHHPHEGEEDDGTYDHNAFVGRDEAQRLDDLSPEESREELGKIFHKIDVDGDGTVTEEELKQWIMKIQRRYITTDTDRQWVEYGVGKDGSLEFSLFMKKTYGYDSEDSMPKDGFDYGTMLKRDKRRWNAADKNQDGLLSRNEFEAFLHPEEFDHMHEIVIEETLEDIDKDGDGMVSLDEYIGDMWPDRDRDPNAAEPDWVQSEREAFARHRDMDGDGYMNREELGKWLLPTDYDHASAEARHLIQEAGGEGKISKKQMLDKHDVFVGSQALDFGEALRYHDEF